MAEREGGREMISKLFESKLFQVIFSFVAATAVWAYVVINTDPQYTSNLNVTNIEYFGMNELTDNNFYIIDKLPENIEVRVSGSRSLVTKITDGYVAALDFSGITNAGEYTLDVKVSVPPGVELHKVKPESIKVHIDVGKTRTIETKLNVLGKNVSNYDVELNDKYIDVTGPSSIVDKIERFDINVNTDEIKKEGKVKYEVIPSDSKGNVLTDKLTYTKTVDVSIRGIKTVDVSLDKSKIPEDITSKYKLDAEFSKKSVRICGNSEKLKSISDIKVDLSNIEFEPVLEEQKFEAKLKLPEGVELKNPEDNKVNVAIEYILKVQESS